ncbi:hypothetical protein [Stenotrophomonas sp. NRRL B-14846]|uniref:hypothetical protein n=1 Tax=Stenotrophomonas sp. NRRL B-14846 TaxID=3162882 RepID=UPI003D2A246B
MIYRALQLDTHHPGALRCLSDFLAHEGTEPFAAATLEHALSGAVPLDDDARRMLDDLRFLDIWSWGFSRHVSGEANLSGEAFQQRDDFVFDGPGLCGLPQYGHRAGRFVAGRLQGGRPHLRADVRPAASCGEGQSGVR